MSAKITLQEAREILRRAVEKSVEVGWISTFVVVDEGGNVIRPALLWNDTRSADAATALIDEFGKFPTDPGKVSRGEPG